MSLADAVTALWPYGGPGGQYGSFAGKTEAADPPTLLDQIPNLSAAYDSGIHQYDLSQYFANADTYAIDPAVETGWSLDTNTGILTIDTDVEDTFGPYTVTATNGNGDTESNGFTVRVLNIPAGANAHVSGMFGVGRMMLG